MKAQIDDVFIEVTGLILTFNSLNRKALFLL